MFIKPEGSDLTQNTELTESVLKECMNYFFSGKLKLSEIYTSDEYNSFYYALRGDNTTHYSFSIHYKDYDNSDLPDECFYISFGKRIDKDKYINLTCYFDSEDRELVKRIMGRGARDATAFFNKWAKNAILDSKAEIIDAIRSNNSLESTSSQSVKDRRSRVLSALNKELKNYRYEDFI